MPHRKVHDLDYELLMEPHQVNILNCYDLSVEPLTLREASLDKPAMRIRAKSPAGNHRGAC